MMLTESQNNSCLDSEEIQSCGNIQVILNLCMLRWGITGKNIPAGCTPDYTFLSKQCIFNLSLRQVYIQSMFLLFVLVSHCAFLQLSKVQIFVWLTAKPVVVIAILSMSPYLDLEKLEAQDKPLCRDNKKKNIPTSLIP